MSKEKLVQLQLALFFKTNEERPDKFADKIDEALNGIFDQMPTIIPVPSDAPPEIPLVMMNSKNGKYNCNIARSRIDFTVNFAATTGSNTVQLSEFIELARPFASLIFGYKEIVRFGFVGQYFFKNTDPIKKIQSKYIKNNLGDLEELNIRYNRRFENNGIVCNDIIDISKGALNETGKASQSGVFIQRDMNNVPVETLKIEDVISIIVNRQDKFKLSGIMELI